MADDEQVSSDPPESLFSVLDRGVRAAALIFRGRIDEVPPEDLELGRLVLSLVMSR